jgi:hypothetical protein
MKLGKALKRRVRIAQTMDAMPCGKYKSPGASGRTASARRGGEENASMTYLVGDLTSPLVRRIIIVLRHWAMQRT